MNPTWFLRLAHLAALLADAALGDAQPWPHDVAGAPVPATPARVGAPPVRSDASSPSP